MMRANAASGLNFVDDFTSYTLGQTVYAQTPYSSPDGFGYCYVRDNGGTIVARQEGTPTPHTYIAQTVADNREVYAVLNSSNATAGVALRVTLYHISNSDNCYCLIDSAGWVQFRQFVGGVNQANAGDHNSGAAPVSGDKMTISRSGSTVTVKKNETTVITKTLVGSPTGGEPAFYMQPGTFPPYREIREFGVKEL